MQSANVYYLMVIILPLMLSLLVGVIIPNMIHVHHLMLDNKMLEDWQVEELCLNILREHEWVGLSKVLDSTPVQRPLSMAPNRPTPLFVRSFTREMMVRHITALLSKVHAQVVAEYRASILKPAIERAIKYTRLGCPTDSIKKCLRLLWSLPFESVPYELADELTQAQRNIRNHAQVQARLESALAYL